MEITITKITNAIELMAALTAIPKSQIEVKIRLSNPKGLANEVLKDITGIKTDGKQNSTALIITSGNSTKKIPCSQIITIKIK